MSAVVSVATSESERDSRFYHAVLERFTGLSHVTVEVQPSQAADWVMAVKSPCIDVCALPGAGENYRWLRPDSVLNGPKRSSTHRTLNAQPVTVTSTAFESHSRCCAFLASMHTVTCPHVSPAVSA
jgi:hypothetical protein